MHNPIGRLRSFLREVRRRRVYRVAALYAATAFVVVQAADLLVRGLGFPTWAFSSVVVLAVLGFPVAVVLAWAFQVTPDGVRRKEPLLDWYDPLKETMPVTSERDVPARNAAARYGLALAAVAAVAYGSLTLGGVVGAEDPAAVRSLAVLPLDDLSDDPGQAHFAAGMHDALIGELAQIGGLRVLSRTSTLAYPKGGRSAGRIARELEVDALVEGSVVRSGDSVRIQVQLVGVQPDERHLWARAYERETTDVLRIHGDVAREVAAEIALSLTPEQERRLSDARRVDPEAYEAYLKGMFHLHRQTPEGVERGLAYLDEAIEEDPGDPLPWAGLALGWSLVGHGPAPPADAFDRAEAAARRAVELDSLAGSGGARAALAEAREALAEVRLYADWDWAGAEEAFRRALELNPSLAPAHAHHGWLHVLRGRIDAGIEQMEQARRLDPLNPLWQAWAGWMLWSAGRHDEARVEARRSLELDPDFPVGHYVLGLVHASEGRFEEAIASHREAAAASPDWRWGLGHAYALAGQESRAREVAAELAAEDDTWNTWGLAEIHAALGDRDGAFRWLEAAFERRHSYTPWIRWNPNFAPLVDDPRFSEMVARLELPGGGKAQEARRHATPPLPAAGTTPRPPTPDASSPRRPRGTPPVADPGPAHPPAAS